MADAKTKQPVQLRDASNERGVALAYPIYAGISDGTNLASVNGSGQLSVAVGNTVTVTQSGTVTVDGSVSITGTVTVTQSGTVTVQSTDLDIRDLSQASDSIVIYANTAKDGSGTNYVPLVDADGHFQVDVLSVPTVNVDITAQTLTALKISKDANANSSGNPIYVSVVDAVSDNEKHDYDTATVTKDTNDNHDYTVTAAKTFLLQRVMAASSGAGRYEVQVGALASLATVGVKFGSPANPNVEFIFDPPIEVPDTSTGTIRVVRRNTDNQDLDMYSTIQGREV